MTQTCNHNSPEAGKIFALITAAKKYQFSLKTNSFLSTLQFPSSPIYPGSHIFYAQKVATLDQERTTPAPTGSQNGDAERILKSRDLLVLNNICSKFLRLGNHFFFILLFVESGVDSAFRFCATYRDQQNSLDIWQ